MVGRSKRAFCKKGSVAPRTVTISTQDFAGGGNKLIIEKGEKIHVVMRRIFESQVQRHFAGAVGEVEGAIVRAVGYVFIYDLMKAQYTKKAEMRTTILDLSQSGYIVNVLPTSVVINDLRYETVNREYLAVVDGKGFSLDVNEFGSKR
jgi:hypothetical protein